MDAHSRVRGPQGSVLCSTSSPVGPGYRVPAGHSRHILLSPGICYSRGAEKGTVPALWHPTQSPPHLNAAFGTGPSFPISTLLALHGEGIHIPLPGAVLAPASVESSMGLLYPINTRERFLPQRGALSPIYSSKGKPAHAADTITTVRTAL